MLWLKSNIQIYGYVFHISLKPHLYYLFLQRERAFKTRLLLSQSIPFCVYSNRIHVAIVIIVSNKSQKEIINK